MVEMANTASDELDLARLRALARKKPRTKAGQVRQAWPEIRALLAAGHTLKDVCAWLNEIGIEIGYARLSDYVNQLRRAQPDTRDSRSVIQTAPPATPPQPRRLWTLSELKRYPPSPTHWRICTVARPSDPASNTAPPNRRMKKT